MIPVRLIAVQHACGAAERNERRGRDPVFFSLSYAEMHRDKWRIHIPDSTDTSLLQAATTLTICWLSVL